MENPDIHRIYRWLMPFKSSNQEWLGSLSKISLQAFVWFCDQSCLIGAVYRKIVDKSTCTFLLVVKLKENVQQRRPLLVYICYRNVHKKGHGQCIFTNTFA